MATRGSPTMTDLALGPSSPAEVKARLDAERRGRPHLVLRDGDGAQRIVELPDGRARIAIGRGADCDVALPWDRDVSRVHAELERIGGVWTVTDDGLSRNGTLRNGTRVSGRERLHHDDVLHVGATAILFRDPPQPGASETRIGTVQEAPDLSPAQRRVLQALCRPYKEHGEFATPATNQQICDELFLSLDATKTHLRALFGKFGVEDLPQNQKRVRLAELAFLSGAVTTREL